MTEKETDTCTSPGCVKQVSNRQMRCREHRLTQCRREYCKKMINGKKYCNDHQSKSQFPDELIKSGA